MEIALLRALNPSASPLPWIWRDYTGVPPALAGKLMHAPALYTYNASLIAELVFADMARVFITLGTDGCQLHGGQRYERVRFAADDIRFVDCHGDKCRRSFSFADTGVWCTACHGDHDTAGFYFATARDIEFNELSDADILGMEVLPAVRPAEEARRTIAAIEERLRPDGGHARALARVLAARTADEEQLRVLRALLLPQ